MPQQRMIDACSQFTVRKRTGTAFTKLHVGIRTENASLPKFFNMSRSRIHITASFKYKRFVSPLCQHQSRCQTRRSHANDYRPIGQGAVSRCRRRKYILLNLPYIFVVPAPPPYFSFIMKYDIHRKYQINSRFSPGINRTAHNADPFNIRQTAPQFFGNQRL